MKTKIKSHWKPDADFFKLIKDILDLILDYVIKHNETDVTKEILIKNIPEAISMYENSEVLRKSTMEYLDSLIIINKLKSSN